jgi:HepT-like protein
LRSQLDSLAKRLRDEIIELERLNARVIQAWERAQRTGDDYYLDSVALNLHGFYSGLERIFLLIAEGLDNSVPQGDNWHQALLLQMAQDTLPIRPAVISQATLKNLGEYRGFRHVVRNVYTFRLDPAKLEHLVHQLPQVFSQVKAEVLAFASFLEQAA